MHPRPSPLTTLVIDKLPPTEDIKPLVHNPGGCYRTQIIRDDNIWQTPIIIGLKSNGDFTPIRFLKGDHIQPDLFPKGFSRIKRDILIALTTAIIHQNLLAIGIPIIMRNAQNWFKSRMPQHGQVKLFCLPLTQLLHKETKTDFLLPPDKKDFQFKIIMIQTPPKRLDDLIISN